MNLMDAEWTLTSFIYFFASVGGDDRGEKFTLSRTVFKHHITVFNVQLQWSGGAVFFYC